MNWLLSILYWCIPSARSLGIVALIFSVIFALPFILGAAGMLISCCRWEDTIAMFLIGSINSIPAIVDYILLCKREEK